MKRVVTVLLIFSMIFGSMAGYETSQAKEDLKEYKQVITHPVKGTLYAVQEEEESQPDAIYKKSTRAAGSLEDLGKIMNEQMERYLSAAGGSAAQVKDLTSAEMSQLGMNLKSKITFSLSAYRIPYDGEYTLQYVYEAIGTYPNLSALHTMIGVSYGINRTITNLNVYSPVSAGQMKAKIQSYKSRFNELIAVPKQDKNMSDMEKLLYLHDEIVIRANYDSKNGNDAAVHTPMALLLEGGVVCQAYAGVMNQAANALGIKSLQLASTDHAWNAVELDGKWYYLDATFDDPVSNTGSLERDFVNHSYFLFNQDDIKGDSSHTLDEVNQELYGSILSNMGAAYQDILPKKLQVQLNYLDGSWYYGEGRLIYKWDGESQTGTVFSDIPAADKRACAVCEGKLYVSGSDGVSIYENGQLQLLISGSVKKMVIIDGVLNYKTDAGWQTKVLVERQPEELVTTDPPADPPQKPDPALTQTTGNTVGVTSDKVPDEIASGKSVTPGRVTISSVKNKKKKSIYLKFKKVKNAAGYQYAYATNKKFKKSKSKTTKKLAVTIKKLKKKKTYYVRVRAYSATNGKKKYGEWSKVKKVKIKK